MPEGSRMGKPQGLNALISGNSGANAYFMSLPDYIRQQISSRADNIHTEQELRKYAEKLLEND